MFDISFLFRVLADVFFILRTPFNLFGFTVNFFDISITGGMILIGIFVIRKLTHH